MCGIAGIVSHAAPVDERALTALRDAQRHRGPDDAGSWISPDGHVGLAHRRLSIVDLSPLGHQPMTTRDGALHVVYNGEIYNYPALRAELEDLGCRFASTSDTEVLLHGYRVWGLGVLEKVRGMFAFALYDAERREMLLARDPLGIKPLYLCEDGSRTWFASEVQALRGVADAGGVDPEGLASFLLWGSIAPPRTLYRRIRALPAGTWLRIAPDRREGPTRYWRLEDEVGRYQPMTEPEADAFVRDALLDSARHHLVADVPVGAFLSGGVDSSALVGLLTEAGGKPIRTVTLAFDVAALDESGLAREAAALYGCDHREVPIRLNDVRDRLPAAVRALDQPSIDGVNTYFVSEAAVRAGLKVAVSGVGGDELFGGYASFARVPRIRRAHRRLAAIPGARPAASALGELVASRGPRTRTAVKLALALGLGGDDAGAYFAERSLFSPWEVRRLLAPEVADAVDACDPARELGERVRLGGTPEEERVSLLELSQYMQVQLLRDADAVSMRHSLEVRTPLVDRDLVRAVMRVPPRLRRSGPAKRMLREAPRPPVPRRLWDRRKQGFTLPFETWLRSGDVPLELPAHPWLAPGPLSDVATRFRAGRVSWARIWALLVLKPFLA